MTDTTEKMATTRALMNAIAQSLDTLLNGGRAPGEPKLNGFVVLTFQFNAPPGERVNYVSNADRRTMIEAMKEVTARLDSESDRPPPPRR